MFYHRFCSDLRGPIKEQHPEYTLGDIAKELGRRWGEVDEHTKANYAAMAEKDKARYERVRTCFIKLILVPIFILLFLQDMSAYKKRQVGAHDDDDEEDDDEEDDE